MAKSSYIIKTTTGGEREYTFDEMIDICRQYLEQKGCYKPSRSECIAEIDKFISRFKYVENEDK